MRELRRRRSAVGDRADRRPASRWTSPAPSSIRPRSTSRCAPPRRVTPTAFASLYDECSPGVYGLIRRIVRDRAQSDEVLQEVMLEVWRLAPRFDPRLGSAWAWIMTIAHRRAVDRVRSEAAERARVDRVSARVPPERRHRPRGSGRRTGSSTGAYRLGPTDRAATVVTRAGLLRRPHPDGDRDASGCAARYREDAHPRRPDPPARRTWRRIVSEDLHTMVGLYVVDTLDDDERDRFEAHLADCPSCSAEVSEFRATTSRLTGLMVENPPPGAAGVDHGAHRRDPPGPRRSPSSSRGVPGCPGAGSRRCSWRPPPSPPSSSASASGPRTGPSIGRRH